MSKNKKHGPVAHAPSRQFPDQVFLSTTQVIGLVKESERFGGKPEKLGLTQEQHDEVHLLLRSSALGLLTAMSILSGHPDPREVIEKGDLP